MNKNSLILLVTTFALCRHHWLAVARAEQLQQPTNPLQLTRHQISFLLRPVNRLSRNLQQHLNHKSIWR